MARGWIVRGGFPAEGVQVTRERVMAPATMWIRAEHPDLAVELQVDAVRRRSRMVPTSVTVTARRGHLSTELLREIPLADIVRAGVRSAVGPLSGLVGTDPSEARRSGPTPEVLRQVAAVYRLGYLGGGKPTQEVAHHFGIPRSTAGRWIQLARKRGVLGPTDPRKPGGVGATRQPRRR